MQVLANADVYYPTFAVQKATDGLGDDIRKVGVVGVLVVFVFLDQCLWLINEFVVVEVGATAERVVGRLFVLDLFYPSVFLVDLYLAGGRSLMDGVSGLFLQLGQVHQFALFS